MSTAIIVIILVVIVILGLRSYKKKLSSGCCGSSDEAVKSVKVSDTDERNYPYRKEFKVFGMHCDNCRKRAENALNSIDGIYARVNLGKGEALVLSKKEINDQELIDAVSNAGYRLSAKNS